MEFIDRIPGDRNQVGKRTIKDQISDKLAYMIHSGLLRVGDELPSEREMAAMLGVSRESVRTALGILQARGMITISQGSRTQVLGTGSFPLHESVSTLGNLKNRSFEEVVEARSAIEGQVIWLAAQRISQDEIARLATLVHDQEGMLADPVSFQISDREFHTTLYRACGNALLYEVACDFYDYALEYRRRALQRLGAIARSVANHRDIVEALKTHKPEMAAAAVREHLEQIRKTTLDEMSN